MVLSVSIGEDEETDRLGRRRGLADTGWGTFGGSIETEALWIIPIMAVVIGIGGL